VVFDNGVPLDNTKNFKVAHLGVFNFGGRMLLSYGGRWKIGIFYVSGDGHWCLIWP